MGLERENGVGRVKAKQKGCFDSGLRLNMLVERRIERQSRVRDG